MVDRLIALLMDELITAAAYGGVVGYVLYSWLIWLLDRIIEFTQPLQSCNA